MEDDGEEEEEEKDLSDDGSSQVSSLVSKMKGADLSVLKEIDFRKLAEGMDDLGESESEDETDAEEESEEGSSDEEEGDGKEDDDAGGVMTFSKEKVDEEVERGKAVKNQLGMWREQTCKHEKKKGSKSSNSSHGVSQQASSFPTPQLFGT